VAPSGPPTPLTTGTGRNNRPVFSPDGAAIAFDRWHVGVNRSIWLMAADGSGLRQLTVDDDTNTHPSWFPDSARLAFLSSSGDGWGLWEAAVAGGAKTRLAALPNDAAFATLSPDGSRVAYHTSDGGAVVNLWVAATDGSSAQQLTFESEPAAFPIWSPDGSRLALELVHGDDSYLAVMAADGGEITTLVAESGDSWPFSFSPDGAWVAFAGKRDEYWNLYAVSTAGELRALTADRRLNAYLRYPAWSPRGDRLVYELAETTGDVWMLDSLP
jgi:Tol biopolymer transport system component